MNWVCIDFGTCNTTAAIEIDGKPHIVTYVNTQYFPTIACIVSYGDIKVCQSAEQLRQRMPQGFLQEFKLKIADKLDMQGVQYVDVVREILLFVKQTAQRENNDQACDSVVLTIPANYTEKDKRIDVMRQAARDAGFQNIEFLSEPQAAAKHYAYIVGQKSIGLSIIYDLGGGTFDSTLLDMTDSKNPKIAGSDGTRCGGQFFDKDLYKYISKQQQEKGNPLLQEQKLEDYAACKRLKETLSVQDKASQLFSNGQFVSINRGTFEELIKGRISSTLEVCDSMLHTAGKNWNEVKQILFVGGSTAIPLIKDMLEQHLISHNASNVKIIRNTTGNVGSYNHDFATCLGGITTKITPPPPPPEPIAKIYCNGIAYQLKEGVNSFGRGKDVDFRFSDETMSRKHFTITVTRNAYGKWNYMLTTCSETKGTIINNIEVLDLQSYHIGIAKMSTFLNDKDSVKAGKTIFIFKKRIV